MNMDSQTASAETGRDSLIKYVLTAAVAFLLGFGSAWLYLTKNPSAISSGLSDVLQKPGQTDSALITKKPSLGDIAADKVAVDNQPAGTAVVVQSVSFKRSGWVVVHEADGAGKPGKILGAQLYDAGTFANTKVDLLRGTITGQMYFAMLHDDNGDRAFDPKLDLPITGGDGKLVLVEFQAVGSSE